MYKLLQTLIVPLAFSIVISCNSPTSESKTEEIAENINEDRHTGSGEEDAEFIVEAYSYSLMLQEYAQVAMTKPDIPPLVKEFAKTSAELNKKYAEELDQIARTSNVVLPSSVGTNVLEFKEKLKEKQGVEFAEAYMDVVEDIQGKMVSEYQTALDKTKNTQIRDWVQTALPTITNRENRAELLEEHADDIE